MTIMPLPDVITTPLIEAALREDYGRMGDVTSAAIIDKNAHAESFFNARQSGILAGVGIAKMVFNIVDPSVKFELQKRDGEFLKSKDLIAKVSGNARSILLAERVALNFMGHLSGIASKTNDFVNECSAYNVRIVCTRKTTPLLRCLEKYAVRCGGGYNHRFGLDDAIMIKDNHIAVAGGVSKAIQLAKQHVGHLMKIEIEVDNLNQLEDALNEQPDVILLDNMSLNDMKIAVKKTMGRVVLEASGNITIERVTEIAKTGIDVISIGALTHSVTCLDIGLDFSISNKI